MTDVLLVPVDFENNTQALVDFAITLGKRLSGGHELPKLVLMSSFDLVPFGFAMPEANTMVTAQIAAELKAARKASMQKLLNDTKEAYPNIEGKVLAGDARHSIIETAKETGATMIVINTHGRRGLSRMLIGSVAESVVRTSPVPVLVVPPAHLT